ncbi:MAG: DegV family protein [Clostridiales bacterium]|nr:DegV family protein [Clostridiales bacterium]
MDNNNCKIAIVTDSACDLSDELLARYHIFMVPLRIVYSTREYRDRMEITPEKVYALLDKEVPKSSLPLPQDVTDILDKIVAEGYTDIIYLSISAGLSGSFNLIRLLAMEYTGLRIEVIDSATLSMGLGFMALEAAREAARSGSVAEAVKRIGAIRSSMTAMFVIKTLEYLRKGGRIGLVEGTVGTLLGIRPVIGVSDEGVYHTVAKARGEKKSIDAMIERLRARYSARPINLAIVHGQAKDEAEGLLSTLKKVLTVRESTISQVSPVLGAHTGPGLLGVVAYEADE